ncbi:TPA: DUF4935 domain-containing protein [Bacillus thuringiensis]|nr:DUF4935 domain-containing protein [Bacillus thuringiensis]
MKNEFPEFQGYNDNEYKQLFDECTFVFDTNVLLNLYKYSTETKNELLEILDKIKDKLWMPHQVGLEYNFNRLSVISDQEKFYNDLIKDIKDGSKKLIDGLDTDYNKKHPYIIWDEIKTQLNNCIEGITEEIKEKQKGHPNLFKDDEILTNINKLFDGKIGEAYSKKDLEEIYKEGKERFARECPPGYKDLKDKKGQIKEYGGNIYHDEYGDLVVWYQIIKYAEKNKKPIIFVTDDNKEDWWRKQSGKTIGPRIELLNEFRLKAKVPFYMYRTDNFMRKIRTHLHEDVNNNAIEEVKKLNEDNTPKNEYTLTKENLTDIQRRIKELKIKINNNSYELKDKPKIYDLRSKSTTPIDYASDWSTELEIKFLINEIHEATNSATELFANHEIQEILDTIPDDYERISRLKRLKKNIDKWN